MDRIYSTCCIHICHVPFSRTGIWKQLLKCVLASLLSDLLQDEIDIFFTLKNKIKRMLLKCAKLFTYSLICELVYYSIIPCVVFLHRFSFFNRCYFLIPNPHDCFICPCHLFKGISALVKPVNLAFCPHFHLPMYLFGRKYKIIDRLILNLSQNVYRTCLLTLN